MHDDGFTHKTIIGINEQVINYVYIKYFHIIISYFKITVGFSDRWTIGMSDYWIV